MWHGEMFDICSKYKRTNKIQDIFLLKSIFLKLKVFWHFLSKSLEPFPMRHVSYMLGQPSLKIQPCFVIWKVSGLLLSHDACTWETQDILINVKIIIIIINRFSNQTSPFLLMTFPISNEKVRNPGYKQTVNLLLSALYIVINNRVQ